VPMSVPLVPVTREATTSIPTPETTIAIDSTAFHTGPSDSRTESADKMGDRYELTAETDANAGRSAEHAGTAAMGSTLASERRATESVGGAVTWLPSSFPRRAVSITQRRKKAEDNR
jgi:hypothetical protein